MSKLVEVTILLIVFILLGVAGKFLIDYLDKLAKDAIAADTAAAVAAALPAAGRAMASAKISGKSLGQRVTSASTSPCAVYAPVMIHMEKASSGERGLRVSFRKCRRQAWWMSSTRSSSMAGSTLQKTTACL